MLVEAAALQRAAVATAEDGSAIVRNGQAWRRLTAQRWWPAARRTLGVAFLLLVALLMWRLAQRVDWAQAWSALRALPTATLVVAAALAAFSHLLYSSYDLIGRHQTRHRLPPQRVAAIGFTAYVFNLNLGSLVGGFATRFRLYGRAALPPPVVTQVLGFSLLTNWLGYLALAGSVLVWRPPVLPPALHFQASTAALRGVGAVLLLAALAYLALCFGAGARRVWRFRGQALRLPSGRMALLQLALSVLNWSTIAGVSWLLLQQRIDFAAVLTALLTAAVAGVITHVPAGLGVIEAVFVALLSHRAPAAELLGALLAYRGLYYLAPLTLAAPLFLWLDRAAPQGTDVTTAPAAG